MTELSTASKYILTTTPPLPSKCVGCGKDAKNDEPFVDLTNSLDYYGAVLICSECAHEIATELLGLVSTDLVDEVTANLEIAEAFISAQTEKMKALERVVAAYAIAVWDNDRNSSESSDQREERSDEDSGEGESETSGKKRRLFE